MSLEIAHLPLPERADDPTWVGYVALSNEESLAQIDHPGWNAGPEQSLRMARSHGPSLRVWRFVATLDGAVVGIAKVDNEPLDDATLCGAHVYVSPAFRGRGIGRALADQVWRLAADEGLTRVSAAVLCQLPTGERLTSPVGVGAVPADDPGVVFALAQGMALGQVERVSRYVFAEPAVDLDEAVADALAAAGPDYELVTWKGLPDPGLADDLATLRHQITLDAPLGELVLPEEHWDADRLMEQERNRHEHHDLWRAAARHVPSGHVVALSELNLERTNPDALVQQWDTIVMPEHRGHRLGMLVKAANLVQIRPEVPASAAILTWNAAENRHMLDINEALGFVPFRAQAEFQRVL